MLPFGMLNFPHPLLARHEDFQRAFWRLRVLEIQSRAPDENYRHKYDRNRGPKDFQRDVSLDGFGALVGRTTAILDHEIENCEENQGSEKQSDCRQDKI